MPPTTTLSQFNTRMSISQRLRAMARDMALRLLAPRAVSAGAANCVRFPYYHHVFDDERAGFARQIKDLARFGEFISMDDAVGLLAGGGRIDGRYFCLSFDDGLKSCVTGALPILAEAGVPATFYVVSSLMGQSFEPGHPVARDVFGFKGRDTTLDFMDWQDCRTLIENGMTIGSHSASHPVLGRLPTEEAAGELRLSKAAIEETLGIECLHFCAPYGLPGTHFDPRRDPGLARDAGYKSFATGLRGPSHAGADVMALRRDHLLAAAGDHQHRYFLLRD